MRRLHALIVARHGQLILARAFHGPSLSTPVNIKSGSKSIVSALVGIAIARGLLEGTDQRVAPLLGRYLPRRRDPRIRSVTIGHLLSMQAGLRPTSGPNYSRWVGSRNWVRFALAQPFVDKPGGRMLYSTANTHMLSTILTRRSGRSTLQLAREWLGSPLGVRLPPWPRGPQGIYFGGNNMKMSPRALLRFGEMYRNGGMHDGKRVLPESWVRESWRPRTRSPYTGDFYGYGWFITGVCGRTMYYARGFGGQMIYVLPSLALTIVVTSDEFRPTRRGVYRASLRKLVAGTLFRAAVRAGGAEAQDYEAVAEAGANVPNYPEVAGSERSFGAPDCNI